MSCCMVGMCGASNSMTRDRSPVDHSRYVSNLVLRNMIPAITTVLNREFDKSQETSEHVFSEVFPLSKEVKSIADRANRCLTENNYAGAVRQLSELDKVRFTGKDNAIAKLIINGKKKAILDWMRSYRIRTLISQAKNIFLASEEINESKVGDLLLGLKFIGEHYITENNEERVDDIISIFRYPDDLYSSIGNCETKERLHKTSEIYKKELENLLKKKESKE